VLVLVVPVSVPILGTVKFGLGISSGKEVLDGNSEPVIFPGSSDDSVGYAMYKDNRSMSNWSGVIFFAAKRTSEEFGAVKSKCFIVLGSIEPVNEVVRESSGVFGYLS
jgi:hypothetical protein